MLPLLAVEAWGHSTPSWASPLGKMALPLLACLDSVAEVETTPPTQSSETQTEAETKAEPATEPESKAQKETKAEPATEPEEANTATIMLEPSTDSSNKAATSATNTQYSTAVDMATDTVSVVGSKTIGDEKRTSEYRITEQELQRFQYSDIHRVAKQAPGIYVRGEDGYGLRPNIGLRGANSDRSAKITLMEDGILLAPAPYSAPAAYYFPLMARMTGVDIHKGSAALRFGPNTIGGALDLHSRSIPSDTKAFVDIGYGTDRFGRVHGYWGKSATNWGVLLEGVHLQTDGFKRLASGANTGFDRNEIVAKARYNSEPGKGNIYHQLAIKAGYADEESRETYLGLSQQDFDADPVARYPASELGLMDWQRSQFRLGYSMEYTGDSHYEYDANIVVYRHDFSRDWRKLNRFRDGPSLYDILNNPTGQNAVYHAVVTGAQDSSTDGETLDIGTNARSFVSQGIAAIGHWSGGVSTFSHELEFGARFHYDQIERNHTQSGYLMRSGVLLPEVGPLQTTARNQGSAKAWSFHVRDQLQVTTSPRSQLLITPGLRLEVIDTTFEDNLLGSTSSNTYSQLLPGVKRTFSLL